MVGVVKERRGVEVEGETVLMGDVVRFYELPCSADEESGRHFDLKPENGATPGCIAQGIQSFKVL